jgi:hypothetical protein
MSSIRKRKIANIYFISGHLDITFDEFFDYYAPKLRHIINNEPDAKFVVGDAKGCDCFAQTYLSINISHDDVTVYNMFDSPRNNAWEFKTIGGFKSDEERDAAMTKASTHDIAWVRPGREKSGTAKNLERRKNEIKE